MGGASAFCFCLCGATGGQAFASHLSIMLGIIHFALYH